MKTSATLGHDVLAEASGWFVEFRTADLTPAQRDRFNDWLRASPLHIQAYLEVALAWGDLPGRDTAGCFDIDKMIAMARASSEDNVVSLDVPRPTSRARELPTHRSRARLATAASLLIAVVGAIAWAVLRNNDTYTTGIGEQRTIRLADGSAIELNARTKVEVHFTQTQRRIDLHQGQALFHVAKDHQRPFIVETDGTHIRAVGTQFDVYRKHSGTIVTVVEGRIAVFSRDVPNGSDSGAATDETVESRDNEANIQHATADRARGSLQLNRGEFLLAAGEQITLQASSVRKAEHVDIATATAWTQKRLVFEDTPLSEVAEEFNRYSPKRLVVTDAQLEHVGISGLYSSTDPTALITFLKVQPTMQVTETESEILVASRKPH